MDVQASPDLATLAAGADRPRYDRLSRVLHWSTALLVVTQFALAELWGLAPRPERHLMIVAHMSFGILLTFVLILRIFWRLVPGHRLPPADGGRFGQAAKSVHYALYALLGAQALLGFVLRWSGDEAMSFFGLLIPPPFAAFSKPAHEWIGAAHDWVGWTIMVVACGHALVALYHHLILRDDVLRRMV